MERKSVIKTRRRSLGILVMVCGVITLVLAAALYAYNIWDDDRAAKAAQQTAQELYTIIAADKVAELEETFSLSTQQAAIKDNAAEAADSGNEAAKVVLGGVSYIGIIDLPTLGLTLPVAETLSYPKLKVSPCRFTGDINKGALVIAAHNYQRHFGGISNLKKGDVVIMTDMDGFEHSYCVESIITVEPTNVQTVVASGYDLTLFTCTYNGQARVVVRCIESTVV
ncbi:MAG: sortase [Clostridiales bacterium]|nr:sortase [Clostridiales bacterium]